MDLHVIGPLASPAERAAVDAVLGPPESGWVGGPRDSGTDGHAARGGHATRSRRSLLLPALHAVQSRIGWISTPALNYICKRLAVAPAEAYGTALTLRMTGNRIGQVALPALAGLVAAATGVAGILVIIGLGIAVSGVAVPISLRARQGPDR
jgi:NADH-quinone oxidoreductase subunit F